MWREPSACVGEFLFAGRQLAELVTYREVQKTGLTSAEKFGERPAESEVCWSSNAVLYIVRNESVVLASFKESNAFA